MFAQLPKYFVGRDAGCILRFEERILLVEKINKFTRTFVNPGDVEISK